MKKKSGVVVLMNSKMIHKPKNDLYMNAINELENDLIVVNEKTLQIVFIEIRPQALRQKLRWQYTGVATSSPMKDMYYDGELQNGK
jgi:hypothetical protein